MTGKVRKKIHRLVSLFTLCAFLFQQMSFASPPSLDIPAGAGKIENGKIFETKKIIFHIQDAHGNEDAQKNIQAILEYLTSHHDQKIVLLEGGNGKLHPELLNFFPKDPELNLKIADSLLKKAELTGAEKFLLQSSSGLTGGSNLGPRLKHSGTTTKNVVAYGIESIPAYRENRQAFQKVLRARTKTTAFLSELDDQIQRLAGPRLNILLKNFLKKSEDHETGRIDFMNWLLFLKEQSKKYLSIDLDDPFYQLEWPMLIRLFRLHANESKIQQPAIASEKEAFLAKLPSLGINAELIKKIKSLFEKPAAANAASSQFPLEEALQAFGELLEALPADFSFKPYENLRLQIQSQILRSEIKSDLLAAETERLESLVTEKLIQNETEKKLVGLYKNYALLKKLFRLELTLEEYQSFIGSAPSKTDSSSPHVFRRGSSSGFPTKAFGNDGSLRPSTLTRQFAELNSDRRVKNVSFSHLAEINQLFDLALSFYAGARKRDRLMADNALKVMRHFKQESAILVTGGFHSEGMKEYFESKGFSYYLITPNIQEIGSSKAYLAAMLAEGAVISRPNAEKSHIANILKIQPVDKMDLEETHYGKRLTSLVLAELRTIPDLSGIDVKLLQNQYGIRDIPGTLTSPRSEVRAGSTEISKNEGERKTAEGKQPAEINASFSSSEGAGQWLPTGLPQWLLQKWRRLLSTNPFYVSFLSILGGRTKIPIITKMTNRTARASILLMLSPVNIFVAMLAPSTTGTRLKSIFPNSYRLNGVNITALISKLFILFKYIFINNQLSLPPLPARSEVRSTKSKAISPEDARHASWQAKMAAEDMAVAPEVLKHYFIGAVKKIGPASFGLGEHGKALLVESDQGKYILKPLTTALYPELIDGARYEVSVVNELVRKGFPAAPLVETAKTKAASKEDRFFVEAANGKIYLLYRFVEGKSVSYERMNRTQFNSFVDTLASFHQTLKGFKPAGKRSRPSIIDFKAQKERLDQLKALLLRKQANVKTPLSRGEKFFLEQVDFILDQLSVLNLHLPPPVYKKLPKAKIDGDYHPGNVVFQGNRVLAVFDWDHLREEPRIYDFSNELFPNITSDKRFNIRELLRAAVRYEKTQPLNPLEKEMLPEMARLKFLDLATWMVRPEKISERHQYDLSAVSPLEQAIAILDRNDHVFAWFQDNLAVLKDIDQRIREGNFKILRSEARTGYDALESRAKALASAFRRQKEVEQADEKLNELIREWIQMTPPAQKVSWPAEGVLGFKNAESGFTFWHDLAASVQNSSFEQKIAALSALAVLLTAAHTFYAQKAKENERNRGTRLFYYDHALQPLLVLRTLSPSAENLHDLAVNYFHLDELSRAGQLGLELLDQNNLSPPLTRAVNVLIGYIKVKKAWQSYQKARQNTGSEEDAKILYRQAVDLARDGASVFDLVLRKYQRNPQDSRQIARAWTGLSSIERTFILSTQELLKMEKSRKTTASMRLEITGRAVHALHAAVQSLLTAKARGNDASYRHSLEKSHQPLWEGPIALDKILDGFVQEGVGILEDHQIHTLQTNLDQFEILLNGKTLWNENYTPVVPAADPKAQHLLAQIQTLRDWIHFREETKQKITQYAKDLASGNYAEIDTFKKELEFFVVEDLKKSPALAKIPELASDEDRLQKFFQDVYSAFSDLSLEELYVLKSAFQQSAKRKSELFHTDDMAEIAKSANEDLILLLENHVPLTSETAAEMIQTPFFKTAGFRLETLAASQKTSLSSTPEEKQEIAPYSDKDVLKYGENDPRRFEAIVALSKKLGPWVGPARTAAYQKIQDEAQKQLDFFLEEYRKWKKHAQADRKSSDRLSPEQARRIKEDLYKYRMDKGYYPLMMELERMQKNDLTFVRAYLQTGHHQGREAGITLQEQEEAPLADSPLHSHGLVRIRYYEDFLKAFYRHTGFSWAAIAVQEMKEIEQTLLRIRDSEKDPDYLSFEAYQTEIQKGSGIYLEIKHYQEANGVKIEKMLATVTALKETLGKAPELALASKQKTIFENSIARLSTRVEAVSRRLQNVPRDPEYWDRTQEAKRMAAIADKLLSQAAFLLKGAQRIQELQKTLQSQKELLERDGLSLEPSGDSPDKDWFQKTKTAGEELAAVQKLFSVFQEERFDEKKIDIFRSKLAGLDQNISPVLETLRKLTAEIAQIKKDRIFEETGKAIKLWGNFIEDFILKVFPGENLVKKSWQEINGILSDFSKEPRKQGSLAESFFRLMDAIDKALEIDDYQKIQIFREAITKTIGSFPLPEDTAIDMAAVRLLLKKEILLSVRKTSYGMPQEPQIASNPANIAPEDIAAISTIINGSYPLIAAQKIFEPWSFFDNEHSLRAWRHELLSFALTFSFYAQMLEGRRKGFSIPDAHAVLEKNFALAFKRQRDYLESKKGLAPAYLTAFDQVRQRAEKQPGVPRDSRRLPLSSPLEQQIEAVFDSFAPEEIFRRIDFTQSLMKAEDSRLKIPAKVVQDLLAKIPQIDSVILRQNMIALTKDDILNPDPLFRKILGIFSEYGIPLDPAAFENMPFARELVAEIFRELNRQQPEKSVNAEAPPEFNIPVNADPETMEKLKSAALLLEKGLPATQSIEEIIQLARTINPAFKTRFEGEGFKAATPEDQQRLFLEIQWQVLLPLHLVAYEGGVWPVRPHTWKKLPDSYGHPGWSVEVTAPPEAFSSFYGSTVFFVNPRGSRRAGDNHFHELWAVMGRLPVSPVLKEKIRPLISFKEIAKDNYYERIFLPYSLASARKNIQNYIYAQLRRSGEIFSTEPLAEYTIAFEILKKTSPLHEGLASVPRQIARTEQVIPLFYFANQLEGILSQMRDALGQKDPALAYLYFLIFLYNAFYIFEKATPGSSYLPFLTTFFKDLAREAGIPLENPDVLPAGERLKALNTFTGALLEKIENGEGVKGLHAPEQALQFLERIYAKHFWTEAERLERLNSKAGLSEPESEKISPAAAMLREAYQPPAASPKTIGAVIEILRSVSAQQEPFAPASLQIMDARLEEIAKSVPEVDAVQAVAIVKGILRLFRLQESKPDFPAEIKKLETYPAIKLKIFFTRIWAAFFVFYLEGFQVKEYRETQEPSDREILLQLARALDPRLADLFQEFTGLMLQPQKGKTLADLPPSSVISEILAPWKDSFSGEELQKAALYAFNYFLYPAGMLLARFPSDAVSERFTPVLYATRSDIDLNLIHLGTHTQWSLAGIPIHYGRFETFTTPLIPGTAISNKMLQDFPKKFALWLKPELFAGTGREDALKKIDKTLSHSFSEKIRPSPLPYSLNPETIAGLDTFFAALKKKAFSDTSSAKSGGELIEKIKSHGMRFQTVLELYQTISREREWGKRFGEEKKESLRLLFSLRMAENHFPFLTFDGFHDFLLDFTANPGQQYPLQLLNALLPETAPLAHESDPKRRTEQLEEILSSINLEKLAPELLWQRGLVFMQSAFGEDLFKDFQELHIRAPLAQITELEKDAPPFVRSEARTTGYFFLDKFGELTSKNQITLKDDRLLMEGKTIAERTPKTENIFQILENGVPHLSRRIKIAEGGKNSARLFAEAKALLKLQNPPSVSGVPRLLGIGFMEDGGLWIELDGIADAHSVHDHDFSSPAEVLDTMIKAGTVLQELHKKGIIHNDINPRNLLIDSKGEVQVNDLNGASEKNASAYAFTSHYSPVRAEGLPLTTPMAEDTDTYSLILTLAELFDRQIGKAEEPLKTRLKDFRDQYLSRIFHGKVFPPVDELSRKWEAKQLTKAALQLPRDQWRADLAEILGQLEKDRAVLLSEIKVSSQPAPEQRSEVRTASHWKSNMPQEGPLPVLSPPRRESVLESFEKFVLFKNGNEQDLQILIQQAIFETWFAMNRDIQEALRAGGEKIEENELVLAGELCHGACTKANQDFQRRLNSLTNMLQDHPLEIFSHSALHAFKGSYRHAFTVVRFKESDKMVLVDPTLRQFFDRNFQKDWLEPIQSYFNREENRYVKEALFRDGFISLDEKVARIYAAAFRGGKEMEMDLPFFTRSTFHSYLFEEMPSLVDTSLGSFDQFLPEIASQRRWIDGGRSEVRREFQQRLTLSQTVILAKFLGGIVPLAVTAAVFTTAFTAIFGEQIMAVQAKERQGPFVTADQLENVRKAIGDFDSSRLTSLLAGDNSFAILDLPVPEGLSPGGLRKTLEEFKPFLQNHPHKILLLAYPGSLPDYFNEDLAAAFDHRVFVMQGGPEVYAGFYAGRFSKLGANEAAAKDVLRRAKEFMERVSAQEISHGPVTVEVLKKYSLAAGPEQSLSGLFGIAKQFVDQPLKVPAQREFEIKLLFLLPASSLSNAEILKQPPDEFEFRNVTEGTLQMLFKQELLARIQALAEAARHILSAA